MKRRKLPIIVTSLASVLLLGSCAEYLPEPEVPKFEVKEHYMVSFYVDNALYKTARVEAGATVNVEIEAPEKDGFTFEGWQTSDGVAFDLSTSIVNSDLSLYALFETENTGTPTEQPWKDLNVTEAKDPTKEYSVVIGWWKRYISEDTMKHFYYNIRNYLIDQKVEESILNGITVRKYDIQGIDDLVPLVNGDGDVDIFFGAGGNFDDKFGTDKVTIAPTGGYSIGEETKRYNAIFDQNNATAKLIYDFMNTEDGIKLWDMNTLYEGKTEEPSEPNVSADNVAEADLNVKDTKVENKKYHLVIVWYGKTKTSGIDETLMKHFYHNVRAYLIDKGITQTQLDNISVRMFDDSKTDDFAKNIVAQGDVDLVFGGGKAIINSFKDAGQELLETTDGTDIFGESGFTIGGKASRYHGRLTDDAVAKDLFDYVSTEEGMKMWDATYEYGK